MKAPSHLLSLTIPLARVIALRFEHENVIRLFDAYTGRVHAQIFGQAYRYVAFIRDGTALAYYSLDSSLRIWDVADLTSESRHSTDGYKHMLQGMTDGWMMGREEPLL